MRVRHWGTVAVGLALAFVTAYVSVPTAPSAAPAIEAAPAEAASIATPTPRPPAPTATPAAPSNPTREPVTPTSVPEAPTAVPTLSLTSSILGTVSSGEGPSPWLQTARETGLWAGPDREAKEFVKVPAGTIVRAMDRRGTRTLVYFDGDRSGRKPGEAWVESADVRPTLWPRWIRARKATTLRSAPSGDAVEVATLPERAWVETVGEQGGAWARVFYLGDGRTAGAFEGWVEPSAFSLPIVSQETLAGLSLTRRLLSESKPEVWIPVPYRSQIDGSPYAEANCGPTTVSMLLEAFGKAAQPGQLREAALELQGTPDCDVCGLFIENLAAITEAGGIHTSGLRGDDDKLRRWTTDEIREQLRAGRLVVPQVMFRFLPGRETSSYWGDHYVVLTGIVGDRFIYNDPIDSDGTGYGRLISSDALEKAMAASDYPFAAYAAGP